VSATGSVGCVPVRIWAMLGQGQNKVWAGMVPFSLFLLSFILFPFLFPNSDLIQILCKFGSKPFKQIPKFFKSSKQCFKPVINQVSKTKDNF
jgi:hypothetical protein